MIEKFIKTLLTIFFDLVFYFNREIGNKPNLNKLIELYQSGDFSETFSRIRIWDAPFEIIEHSTPKKGIIVDLGCGDGLIANYLALSSIERKVIGIEINSLRIKDAQKGIKNTEFKRGDILKNNFPVADTILLVHVLHHLSSYEEQSTLIKKCRGKLKKNGKIIIVEIDHRPILKFILTWIVDTIIFSILFENKLFNFNIFYRSKKKWKSYLEHFGFKVKTISAHKNKPFSHFIFYCKKL